MGKFTLQNVRLYAAGVDLSSMTNKTEWMAEVEDKECTTFGSNGFREYLGGLKSVEISSGGYWEAGDTSKVDNETWSDLGSVIQWSMVPNSATPAVGDLAYFTSALRSDYKIGDAVGEVAPWEAKATGSGVLVRGSVMHPPGTARIASGNGTGHNLGALSASQKLYANLHVISVAGTDTPTITVRIESDADDTWASPTTRFTFTAATAIGGQTGSVVGAVTDTWWRPAWTISGTSPSFLFLVTMGVA